MTRYYDVVVLGRSVGALTTAALLARRDFQVLLLGQGQRPPSYRFEGRLLKRRAFTMLAASSPVWHRVLHELAHTPTFRRHTRALDPMFAVLMRGRRVEVPPDVDLFAREIEREFPEVRQLVDELYATFSEVNAAGDDTFERDAMWPPGTFWERLETNRAAAHLPLADADGSQDLLGKFPAGHPYRELTTLPAIFSSHLAPTGDHLPPFALARLHGGWTRGVQELPRGEDELEELLIERIESHGGVCRLDTKAASLVVERGAVVGVLEDGEDEPFGTGAVVSDQTGEMVADLAGGEGITKAAKNDWPHVTAAAGRFVVSIVVSTEGVPEPLPHESFLAPAVSGRPDPRRPAVHLQRVDDPEPTDGPSETLLVAEAVVPTRGPLTLLEAREAILATVREHLPFFDRHVVLIDSPHDGLPLYQFVDGRRREIDRIHLEEGTAGVEPLGWMWAVDPPGFLRLGGEPVRGPIPGTYLAGTSVLPALGQEGEILAAWSAARLVTRKDRRRQKMRRQMWSRVETG